MLGMFYTAASAVLYSDAFYGRFPAEFIYSLTARTHQINMLVTLASLLCTISMRNPAYI